MFSFSRKPARVPTADEALPGRPNAMSLPSQHLVFGVPLDAVPAGCEVAVFGLGCFWGAERMFYRIPGVVNTAAGYAGGHTPNPTYEEVCSGMTGHNEVVRVVFDPLRVSFAALISAFFEAHDPTQGMRQGNDVGTQYRSGIYAEDAAQEATATALRAAYGSRLAASGLGAVTTEIVRGAKFYFAEPYHQQYLHANPNGYCGLRGTGVACPV